MSGLIAGDTIDLLVVYDDDNILSSKKCRLSQHNCRLLDLVLDSVVDIRYVVCMGRGPAITIDDITRVVGIAAHDPTITPAALERLTGRTDDTCAKLLREYGGVIEAYRHLNKRQIVEDIDAVRRGYLARLADPNVILECSGPQAAVVFGIMTDKLLLESGRPTSITLNANADISLPDVLGRLQKAIEGRQTTRSSSGRDDNGGL